MLDPTQIVNIVPSSVRGTLNDAWQVLLGDRVAAWRLKNAAKIQVQTAVELAKLGVTLNPAQIPERYAISWFEEATKQDEEELQVLFARLLARAANGEEDALDRRLLDIVSRLVPDDAQLLEILFWKKPLGSVECAQDLQRSYEEYPLIKALEKQLPDPERSLNHLQALGVFERDNVIGKTELHNFVQSLNFIIREHHYYMTSPSLDTQTLLRLTSIGRSLIRAIKPIDTAG